jgi:serine/threonine protein kinase/tetratricopeptide (TPR) repeat protein
MKLLSGLSAEWPIINDLLDQALVLPKADRERWLRELPDSQAALRETLRHLLAAEGEIESSSFLDSLPSISGVGSPAPEVAVGDLIGPYRVLREIGAGGMGSVWLAERADGVLKRQIALKLPRLAWIAGLAERMERERDILSQLEHPHIARLYDAGVDQRGRPYLAIELVHGERIDRYCDERRLDLRERVRLFLQVLDAVRYAHTHLVIHRDLKPANVLVNERGEAQLLDFGIARLQASPNEKPAADLRTKTATEFGARAMTLRYASPEQVQGRTLSVASDVYSLGVMLYELLTGTSPYVTQKDSSAEIETAIIDGQLRLASRARINDAAAVARGSTSAKLSRSLQGDLDAVLLRSLAKEMRDRFSSVDAFHQDLSRWLEGEPVASRPASRWYVLQKFVARHRLPVVIGATGMLGVITMGVVAVLLALEAREESRKATAARDFMMGMFEQANPGLHGGRDITTRQMLVDGENQIRTRLAEQPMLQAELLVAIAGLWEQLGDAQRARILMERRAAVVQDAGDIVVIATARIDEATRAIAAGDVERARLLLGEIDGTKVDSRLPTLSRIDWRLNRAWISMQAGAYALAVRDFSSALDLAQETDNVDRQLIALTARVRAAWLSGDAEQSRRDRRLAIGLLGSPRLAPTERIARGTDLIAWAYEIGDYRETWSSVQTLVRESARIYGAYAASQRRLRLYWLRFAWRVQQPEVARQWLHGLSTFDDLVGATVAERVDRRVAEASVWQLLREAERVRSALDDAWRQLQSMDSTVSPDERLRLIRRLALWESSLAAVDDHHARATYWLGDRTWQWRGAVADLVSGARNPPGDAKTELLNLGASVRAGGPARAATAYRGLAAALVAEQLGLSDVAAGLFAGAVTVAEAASGSAHPDTNLLRLNRELFLLRNKKTDSRPIEAKIKNIEALHRALLVSFPVEHTAVKKASALLERLRQRGRPSFDQPPESTPTMEDISRPERFY